jgi:hypothetical protein
MKSILTLIAVSSLLAPLALAQTPRYTITDLGAQGPFGQPYFITDDGLISGTEALPSKAEHAYLRYKGLTGYIGALG